MFCNKCGNILSDDAKFCNRCGNSIEAMPSQPVYTQPTYTQPTYSQPTYAQPTTPVYSQYGQYPQYEPIITPQPNPNIPRHTISKKEYIKRYSHPNIKTINTVSFVASLVCLAVILFNFFYSYFGCSIFLKVPLTKTIFYFVAKAYVEDLDMQDYERNMRQTERDLRRSVSELKDELSYADVSRKQSKAIVNTAKNPSVNNVLTLVNTANDDDIEAIENTLKVYSIQAYITIFKNAAYISLALAILGFVFALCGVLAQKRSLITTGFVLSLIYSIIFGGWLQSILLVIGFVTVYVLNYLINKHYNNFQLGLE